MSESEETEAAREPTWLEANSAFRTVKLRRPIRVNGQDVTELRIREPILDDFERLPASAFEKPMTILGMMIAQCSGIPHGSARLIAASDVTACAEALAAMGFIPTDAFVYMGSLSGSRPTGENGSQS